MIMVGIYISPGNWIPVPELGISIKHDEIVTKFIPYEINDEEDNYFILRETPWLLKPLFKRCEFGNEFGECVLADGHENRQPETVGDSPRINHINRYGKEWNVADGSEETPSAP